MKTFTFFSALAFLMLGNSRLFAQLNIGTGVIWGELSPAEPLVLDENFQGFEFFHKDENTDQGNSQHSYAADGSIIYGYKNDTTWVDVLNGGGLQIGYYFDKCAFAPEWKTAYAYKDNTENTPGVSNGFVEISRDFPSDPPTVRGYFTVDLRALDFVEVIQWTHSSTGGNKRGVQLEFSLDDGATWDTLRYQPGTNWAISFTKDPITKTKTLNGFRCDPSAYGMTWEDGVYAENVMLRFLEAGGQTARIHDLKVYASFTATGIKEVFENDLKIAQMEREIRVSEQADIAVYHPNGMLLKTASNTNRIFLDELPTGIYIVRTQAGKKLKASKVFLK